MSKYQRYGLILHLTLSCKYNLLPFTKDYQMITISGVNPVQSLLSSEVYIPEYYGSYKASFARRY